jgi:hypothetical protein
MRILYCVFYALVLILSLQTPTKGSGEDGHDMLKAAKNGDTETCLRLILSSILSSIESRKESCIDRRAEEGTWRAVKREEEGTWRAVKREEEGTWRAVKREEEGNWDE